MTITVLLGAISLMISGAAIWMQDSNDDTWYLHQNHYLDPQYTDMIDELLLTAAGQITRHMLVNGRSVPGLGKHYYYPYDTYLESLFYYIGLYKYRVKSSDNQASSSGVLAYQVFVQPWHHTGFQVITTKLLSMQQHSLMVSHIDSSESQPKIVMVRIFYDMPRPNQDLLSDKILIAYNQNARKNVRVIICGARGVGKTFMGRVIARRLPGAQLVENFDPNQIGVDIRTLALRTANPSNPTILMINEIDVSFRAVLADNQDPDPRTKHTRDITSFHNMLDSIADVPGVITIGTTELSAVELIKTVEYRSFMRTGRLDQVYQLTATGVDGPDWQ